ncbi:MarR family winged helix-turn-helix transcriptional regulator [Aquabacterium sp.]|uniref:MarR family winged helix-turn-helix transcriptional regulator n=1 Tax=Aquabacterium sp. TaxID=1872578 RepID=UPI002C2B0994|nr:MarR family transcriptional regulator [Aquabacterium sp.]HSW06435.1 MarR family transcriptional regulator [Aquabacterium sp.]
MAKPASPRQPPAIGEGKRGDTGHIAYLLRQAQAAVRLALDTQLAASGMTTPQFLVLNLLDAYPGASGADLARIAQLTPQTINLIVRKLEEEGLIERNNHETHGRVLRMDITKAGKLRLRQCKRLADDIEHQLLALADAQTQAVVRRWLVDVAMKLSAGQP